MNTIEVISKITKILAEGGVVTFVRVNCTEIRCKEEKERVLIGGSGDEFFRIMRIVCDIIGVTFKPRYYDIVYRDS